MHMRGRKLKFRALVEIFRLAAIFAAVTNDSDTTVFSFIVHSLEDTQYYVKKLPEHGNRLRNCQQNDSFTHCESASEHVRTSRRGFYA